jgi:hypothetical protein
MLLTSPEGASEGMLFSATCSPLRFYTAKTQCGHPGRIRQISERFQTGAISSGRFLK